MEEDLGKRERGSGWNESGRENCGWDVFHERGICFQVKKIFPTGIWSQWQETADRNGGQRTYIRGLPQALAMLHSSKNKNKISVFLFMYHAGKTARLTWNFHWFMNNFNKQNLKMVYAMPHMHNLTQTMGVVCVHGSAIFFIWLIIFLRDIYTPAHKEWLFPFWNYNTITTFLAPSFFPSNSHQPSLLFFKYMGSFFINCCCVHTHIYP